MSIQNRSTSRRLFFFSLALLTGTAISFEILLMRLFSQMYGQHYASMIISLALLGLGTGGVVLQLFQNRLLDRFDRIYPLVAALFGVSVILCFMIAQSIPFNPREMTWSLMQWGYLGANYLLYALPFFCSGLCVAMAMAHGGFALGGLYRADLMGAGAGALLVILSLFLLSPISCLTLLGCTGVVAAALASLALNRGQQKSVPVFLFITAAVLLFLPHSILQPGLSEYKQLSILRHIPGTRVLASKSTPMAQLKVVSVPGSPLRRAPGMSSTCPHEPPPQLGVFADGNLLGTVPKTGRDSVFSYLSCLPVTSAFALKDRPAVFIKDGISSPELLLNARRHNATSLISTSVQLSLMELVRDVLPQKDHSLYFPSSFVHVQGLARSYLAGMGGTFDIMGFWLTGSGGQSVGGTTISEEFDLTVQGVRTLLEHLADNGILAVSKWRHHPPYETLKFLATLQEASPHSIGNNLLVLATPSTVTILFKKSVWSKEELIQVQPFITLPGVEVAHVPDNLSDGSGDRIAGPLSRDIKRILGKDFQNFLEAYKFHIKPATDDRPFFNRFFSWKSFREVLALRTQGGAALMQWEYLLRLATLGISFLTGACLLVVPLAFKAQRRGLSGLGIRLLSYFSALGLGFLFVEITLIHHFTLFLGHPFLSASIVLASFLFWAGTGSGFWKRFSLDVVLAVVIGVLVLYAAALPWLLKALLGLPMTAKILLTVLLCGLPAFFMGMPFPKGLESVGKTRQQAMPWAWGVNGFSSVISPLLAVLLAIHFGFTLVLGLACILYLIALLFRPCKPGP